MQREHKWFFVDGNTILWESEGARKKRDRMKRIYNTNLNHKQKEEQIKKEQILVNELIFISAIKIWNYHDLLSWLTTAISYTLITIRETIGRKIAHK